MEYLEAGARRTYRTTTLSQLESALGWAEGSAQRIVSEGGRPRPARQEADPMFARVKDAWPLLAAKERRGIAELVETLTESRAGT